MGGAASHADAQHAQHAEHYPHDRQDKYEEDDSGVTDMSESDVEEVQKGPRLVAIQDAKNPAIGNAMSKEAYSMAVCRPDSGSANCRSCVPKLKFPLPAPEAVTFPEPINDYEGAKGKPRGPRKQGHYTRRVGELEPEMVRTNTQTSDGGWPTEYLDWLKKNQGSGRQEMSQEEKAAAAAAAEAEQEFKAMSAQLSVDNQACKDKDLERGGLGAPLLGGETKDLGRHSRSNMKGKLLMLGLLLLLLCWFGGGGQEVGQYYTTVERTRQKRLRAAEAAAEAAVAERAAERVRAEKINEEEEAAKEKAAADEAAAEKAAEERAAWKKKMHERFAGGGVPVGLVIVGMLLAAAAVGYCC